MKADNRILYTHHSLWNIRPYSANAKIVEMNISTCREEFEFSLPSQQISVRNANIMESDGAKIDIMRWYCVQL